MAAQSTIAIDPINQVLVPGSTRIYDIQHCVSSGRLYGLVDGVSVDLWFLIVQMIPVGTGLLIGSVVLVALWRSLAIYQRPQAIGKVYCRKCNCEADAKSTRRPSSGCAEPTGTRCTECGSCFRTTPPIIGCTRLLRGVRVWGGAAIAAIIVVGVAAYARSGGNASSPPEIWSESCDRLKERTQYRWLTRHVTRVTRLVELDPATFVVKRTICTMRGFPMGGVLVAPDGVHAAISGTLHSLRWIRLSDGRTIAEAQSGPFRNGDHSPSYILGIMGEGGDPVVYYSALDSTESHSMVVRWRPRHGSVTTVLSEDVYAQKSGASILGRRQRLLTCDGAVYIISAPSTAEADESDRCDLNVYRIQDGLATILWRASVNNYIAGQGQIQPHGCHVHLNAGAEGVVRYDVSRGMLMECIDVSNTDALQPTMPVDVLDGALVCHAARGHVAIINPANSETIARLLFGSLRDPVVHVPRVGGKMVCVAHEYSPVVRDDVDHLVIFDLSQLRMEAKGR